MDVRLSAEQRALRESAAVLVERLKAASVRDIGDRERVMKLDAAVAAAGWRELRAESDDGGPWSSAVEVAIVAEELGVGPADTAFVGPTLAADLRRLAGAPAAAGPETVMFQSNLSAAALVDNGVIPAGAVAIDAAGAAGALALAPTSDGYALAEVEVPSPEGEGVDLTRPFVPLTAAVTATPLADQDRPISADGFARWTALGLALTCADLVGVMRGAIRLTTDYAAIRKQFGVPVGSFQAVHHLLADAFVAMEGSCSMALHAGWAVDALAAQEALAAAAAAKAYCARAAQAVCETAIQVHGGIGNTWECFAHVYLRRAMASSDLFGGVGPNLARVLEHQQIGGGRELR